MNIKEQKIFSFTEKSMERLFNGFYYRLVSYASRIVGSEAVGHDLVQDVFLKLWEKKPEISSESVKAYLFVQTRNTCIMHLRQEKIFNNKIVGIETPGIEYLYMIDFLEESDQVNVREQVLRDVYDFIETLPPQTRNVFRMSRLENLSHRVIADRLSLSEKAIEKHITIALKRFRLAFSDVRRRE